MVATIGEILPAAARRFGRSSALLMDGRHFTFAELDELSNRCANSLLATGVRPGDRVTLYGPNSWQWIIAYFGIAKAGAVVNPINVMLTPDEVKFVVEDSGARAVIASPDKGEPLLDMKGRTADLREVVLWGETVPKGAGSFEDWLRLGKASFELVPRAPGDLGAICYTSGTTGHPKGAMQSHRSILASAMGTALMGARNRHDRVVSALPCAHAYGSCVFNAAFLAGSTMIILPRFTEEGVLQAVYENAATLMDGVPTAYFYLLAYPGLDKYDLSSLSRCTVGGQTMPAAKSLEFTERAGCPLLELWGMTELAGAATLNPFFGINRPGTIGLVMPGNSARIVDLEDASKVLPPGERGELMFKGPLVMDGYYGNEAGTKEAIEPDGWLHTGDVGMLDEDGYLVIVDRKKDMILTAGYNVYPAELERVLCMHPAVALAAVCGIKDEARGELAKAYVVLKPGAEASGAELASHCRSQLAVYKVPRAVQFVPTVPITPSGKILRRLLKDLDDGTRTL